MDTNGHEGSQLLHKELVYSIVGCAIEVLNAIGHGLHEKPCENSLVVELGSKGIAFEQQKRFPVVYKNVVVGEFVPASSSISRNQNSNGSGLCSDLICVNSCPFVVKKS